MHQGEEILLVDRAPGGLSAEAALLGFARTLWRRRWLILATALLVTALGAAAVRSLEPSYRAEVKLMVDPRAVAPVAKASDFAGLPDSEAIQGEMEVLFSRDLAHEAVRSLRLIKDPEFNPALRPPSAQDKMKDWVTGLADRWHGGAAAMPERLSAPGPGAVTLQELTVEEFMKHLGVEASGRSRVITVSFTADTPQRAAEIANAYADLYLAQKAGTRLAAVGALSERLGERVAAAQLDLRAAEQKVDAFRRQAGLGREAGVSSVVQQLTELNVQLVEGHAARIQAESRLMEVDRLVAQGRTGSLPDMQRSPVMAQLRAQEAETARRGADLAESLGARHPQLLNVRAELAEVQRKIAEEAARAMDGLRDDAAVAGARVAALEDAVADLKRQVAEQDAAEVQARELERDALAGRQVLDMLLARAKDVQEEEGVRGADAKLISRADPPLLPAFPDKALMLAVAGMAGVGLGVFLALLIEAVRSGFRSMEEVEGELGVRGLALVPQTRNPVGGLLRRSRSAFAESLRALAIELELTAAPGSRGQVLVVTSPSPAEGKTTLACSLARLMAQDGKNVLLVDADLRRPAVHANLGTRSDPGLGDVLAGSVTLEEAVVPDRASQFDLLPAGTRSWSPIVLLASEGMAAVIDRVRQRYDLVVIDTPPLLPVADARLLGKLADKVVLVLRWGRTKRAAARLAIKYLNQAGAPLAGAVVSRVDTRYHRSYGYGDSAAYTPAAMRYYAG